MTRTRLAWALWPDDDHRGGKLHRHFDVPKGVPRRATVTPATYSEPAELMCTLEPNRLSVFDRGYASYELFAEVIAANSSVVARVKDTTAFAVTEEPSIPPAAPAAGVIRDVLKRSMRSRTVRVTAVVRHAPRPITHIPSQPIPHPTPDRNQCAEQY